MKKRLVIDFYRVQSPVDFADVITKVLQIPAGQKRNDASSGEVVRLRVGGQHDGMIYGDMMRIRQDEPTIVASTQGTETAVAERDDEGLGLTSAFVYVPTRNVLLYQRNRGGVPAHKMAFYFQQKAGLQDAILFDPILSEDARKRLSSLRRASRLHIKMAPSTIHPTVADTGAIFQVVKAARQMERPVVEISFSLGRKKGTLNLSRVLDTLRMADSWRKDGVDVRALQVSGNEDGVEKVEVLDLLNAGFKYSTTVESIKLIDAFFDRRLDALLLAWNECSGTVR